MAILYCSWHLVVNNGNFILQFASFPIRHRRHLCYFKGKCLENHYFKMHLTPNMYKIVTLKANAKKIVTLKCMWHNICAKPLLWRQMLGKSSLENAFDTTYVQNHYFAGKCSGNHHLKMHLTPHMYKIITLQANAKEIITWKCFWFQICTKCYFAGKCSENRHLKMHLAPNMYKIVALKANAQEIVTLKCIWHQICTKSSLWMQMLRKSSL